MLKHSTATIGLGILALAYLTTGCGLPQQREIPPDAQPLGTIAVDQVETQATALLEEFGVDEAGRTSVIQRLNDLLKDQNFAPLAETKGINAIGVFRGGSGGVIVSGGGGNGLVSFAGGSQKVPFEVQGFSMGANVGGGMRQGVILAVGLDHEERFPDRYDAVSTGGSAGEATYVVGEGQPARGEHSVHFVGGGTGFSGTAGSGSFTITLVATPTAPPTE